MKTRWFDWGGRTASRIDSIEQGLGHLHRAVEALSVQIPRQSERAQALSEALGRLEERLVALEGRGLTDAARTELISLSVAALEEQASSHAAALEQARLSIHRLERQLDHYADQASKIATGLIERLEATREP